MGNLSQIIIAFTMLISRVCCVASSYSRRSWGMRSMSVRGGSIPESEDLKPFYALGVNIARQVGGELSGILSDSETDALLAGFGDLLKKKVPDERSLLSTFGPKINEILTGRASKLLDEEKAKGQSFLTKYLLSNPRATQTASGLVFNEVLAGTGEKATLASTVLVHYHGTLPDGTVFDSSVSRGDPIKFPLKNVIKGWQEGVSMMRAGGKATLVVPSELAYGDAGSPPVIPPGATLMFEVELLSVL